VGSDVVTEEDDLVRLLTRSERGASMVEFAIVIPLLLILLIGIIEFGRAYSAKISVTHAAREGVREYSLTRDASAGDAAARNAATALSPARMTVAPTGCADESDIGDQASMVVVYRFDFSIPFVPLDGVDIQARGVMRCGG
jgi:Flp pilus assembly protein TadG